MTVYRGPQSGDLGTLAADGVSTNPAIGQSTTTEETLYTLVIPGGTLKAGDLLRVYFLFEVLTITVDAVRFRMRLNGTALDGFFPLSSPGDVEAFAFMQLLVNVPSGGSLAAARLVGDSSTGVDMAGVDTTLDMTFTFTGQPETSSANTTYIGLGAHLSLV